MIERNSLILRDSHACFDEGTLHHRFTLDTEEQAGHPYGERETSVQSSDPLETHGSSHVGYPRAAHTHLHNSLDLTLYSSTTIFAALPMNCVQKLTFVRRNDEQVIQKAGPSKLFWQIPSGQCIPLKLGEEKTSSRLLLLFLIILLLYIILQCK